MMKTYYSYCNLSSGEHIKPSNSIQGQMFDIINCSNCQLLVLDSCEQVQIDNCQNCHIFIAASMNTVFARNCENCVFFTCSKQLRIRECFHCTYYSYSMSEIHIELSSDLSFGPFNASYPDHRQHLQECNLFPLKNLWYQIYDHNASPGRSNWRLLQETEYSQPWYPLGECDRIIPLTPPQTTNLIQQGQVGQSFTLEQMKQQDSYLKSQSQEATPNRVTTLSPSVNKKVDSLGIETALLVASARAKGIDVAVWLCESNKQKLIPVPDFNSRFISLGLAVGIQEDWETKRELDLATSPASLSSIIAVCGEGFNESGAPLINVHLFLCLCQESADKYIANVKEEERVEEEKLEEPPPPVEQVEALIPQPHEEQPLQEEPIVENSLEEEEEEEYEEEIYPQDDSMNEPEIAERGRQTVPVKEKGKRSNSEPAENRKYGKHILHSTSGFANESASAFEKLLIDVVRHTDLYHNIQVRPSHSHPSFLSHLISLQVHLGYLEPYTMNPARGKVVVSTPRQWLTHSEIQEAFCSARLHLTTAQVLTLINLVKLFSQKYSDGTYRHRISIEDPNTALPTSQSAILHTAILTSTVYLKEKNLLHSEWLKRYLVHLRVHHKVGNWNTWMTTKIHQNAFQRKTEKFLMTEFHKALVGREHTLTEEDLRQVIQKFEIIPMEILRQEIENRIDEWVMDTNGTRDFSHSLHREYKRHIDEVTKATIATGTTNIEEEGGTSDVKKILKKKVLKKDPKIMKAIERKLIADKRAEYENKEKKSGEITLKIFQKYDKKIKEEVSSGATSQQRFGDWLQIYIEKETNQIQVKRENDSKQRKLIQETTLTKKLYSPWTVIEYYLREAIKLLTSQFQNKYLQKYLLLKRFVEETSGNLHSPRVGGAHTMKAERVEEGEGKIILLTKEIFLKYFNESFVEKLVSLKEASDEMLEQEIARKKATQQRQQPQPPQVKKGLFYLNAEEARECGRAHVERLEQKLQAQYNEWRQEKLQQHKESSQKILRAQEEKAQKESQKQKKADKAYKKWLRLHSANKYYSVVSQAKSWTCLISL
jgi:hypothetical protein